MKDGMSFWSSISFQDLVTLLNSELENLHDLVMVWLTGILLVVILIGLSTLYSVKGSKLAYDSSLLEQVWTMIPILILLTIAWPSLHLLCLQDFFKINPYYNLKITSNQWNWNSDSFMFEDEDDHLLDVEEVEALSSTEVPVVSPATLTRVILSSTDVLHSLGLPSLGIKLDSIPGRLNSTTISPLQGLHVGSCYELCGSGHSAMPITMLVLNKCSYGVMNNTLLFHSSDSGNMEEGLRSTSFAT